MGNKTKRKYHKKRSKRSNRSKKIYKNYSKNQSKKVFKKLNCSPKTDFNYTCYSNDSLEKLKRKWNKSHSHHKILTNNPKKIWNELKDKMDNKCNTEKCWLNQQFIKNDLDSELSSFTFAPVAPDKWKRNPNEWLTSDDIVKVMKQFEHKYPSFVFIGPSPIDYDNKKLFGQCVWNQLCNFNLKTHIKKGKKKIGIIFNTDTHDLPGAHWICMFIDVNNKYIYYFDSNADPTPRHVTKFANNVKKQGNALGIKFKYYKNDTEHQKSDTECGMYVLYVISQLLKNKMDPIDFDKRVKDKEMEELRKILFN